jgi:hypothetical protein
MRRLDEIDEYVVVLIVIGVAAICLVLGWIAAKLLG